MSGALIVTAELAPADFAWLDRLRTAHFPPERNRLPAHLTMFHALPPSAEEEVRRQLALHAAAPPPRALLDALYSLGEGVAFRVRSDALHAIRDSVAEHFHGSLSAQDDCGWRPHVTVQNKVSGKEARALLAALTVEFEPRPLGVAGLALHRYLGGPWEALARYPFRGA